MRAVVQRVKKADVQVNNQVIGAIEQGFVIFLGVAKGDTLQDVEYLAKKISQLRIFNDEEGKMKKNLAAIKGNILSISQFTLLADLKKGNRPNFNQAEDPKKAEELYNRFNLKLEEYLQFPIAKGQFGADMQVTLVNDGPVTILYDTNNK